MLQQAVSLFRVVALPVIIFLHLEGSVLFSQLALLVMGLAVVSDLVDGMLAKSAVRSFLDPFADKILVVGLLLFFVISGEFWWWILVFYILRDIIVGVVRLLAGREDVELRGSLYGKIIIGLQYGLLVALLLEVILVRQGLFTGYVVLFEVGFAILALGVGLVSVIHSLYFYGVALRARILRGRRIEDEQLIILANRRSRGYKDLYRRRLLSVFVRRRKAQLRYLPRGKDMFHDVAQRTKGRDHIVIAGGDGSFESALNEKALEKKSLGFFPFGAGNAFYSYFYKGKRFEYLRERFSFQEEEIDVMEISWKGGRRQTLFMGLGLDGEVIGRSTPRTKYGFWDYMRGSVKTLLRSRSGWNIRVSCDGKEYEWKNCFNIILSKIPYYGFGVRTFARRVVPNNGIVYGSFAVNRHGAYLNKILRIWSLVLPVFGFEKAPLIGLKGKKFVVESEEPMALHAGGEYLGRVRKVTVQVVRTQKVLMI